VGARHVRTGVGLVLAAAILAACEQGTPGRTGPYPTTAPTAVPTILATAAGAPTASPSASTITCPPDLPTTIRVEQLADPGCYGTAELAIEGWLAEGPVFIAFNEPLLKWTIPIAGLFADRPTVGEWIYDYLMAGRSGGLRVVADPSSGLDLTGPGQWVTLRGRFNDPEILPCRLVVESDNPGEDARPDCAGLFLVTGVEPLDRAAPDCPTTSPLSVAAFMAADALCFVGREVRVSGWEDVGDGFGGEAPVWRITTGPGLVAADAQLVSHRWESDLEQHAIFPWIVGGSGVRFDRSDVRVVVTGILGHPASAGCRPVDIGWGWTPPLSWAQNECRHLFVITRVQLP